MEFGTNGAHLSLAELYRSGGWKLGSGAMFSYIPEQELNRERVFKMFSDAADTENEL